VTRLSRFIKFGLIAALLGVGALAPTDAFAQRYARPRTSAPVVVAPRYYPHYHPYYYSPFYYPWYGGFYAPFSFSFGFGYGYPYYGYGPYPYPAYYGPAYYGPWAYDNTGGARLQITPNTTQVYADGYFVGVVDSFDSSLQRLNLEAGQHELQFYLDGYRTFTQKVLFVRGRTLKLTHAMEPLAPGESSGPPPKPDRSTENARPAYRGDQGIRPEQGMRPDEGMRPAPPRGERGAFGSLLLRVRPSDAEVMVDGEKWTPTQGDDQFVIELAEGPHSIEVRKNGFQTYSTTVQVRRGQSVRLNVSLTTGGERPGEF
jgi:PEGA domain